MDVALLIWISTAASLLGLAFNAGLRSGMNKAYAYMYENGYAENRKDENGVEQMVPLIEITQEISDAAAKNAKQIYLPQIAKLKKEIEALKDG